MLVVDLTGSTSKLSDLLLKVEDNIDAAFLKLFTLVHHDRNVFRVEKIVDLEQEV